jgi:hypothetical protein
MGQSPAMQLAELREYASRRGFEVVGEYVDEGVSDALRPSWQKQVSSQDNSAQPSAQAGFDQTGALLNPTEARRQAVRPH